MIVQQNPTCSDNSTKKLQEIKLRIAKTRPKSTMKKTSNSITITSSNKLNSRGNGSAFRIPKRTIKHRSRKLNSVHALSNNIKPKIQISKPVKEGNPTISKAKTKQETGTDRLLNLEMKKIKKDSHISKMNNLSAEKNDALLLSKTLTKNEFKIIANSKLISRKRQQQSMPPQDSLEKSHVIKQSKNEIKPIKNLSRKKNGSEKSTGSLTKHDNATVLRNSKCKASINSSSTLDGKPLAKLSRKDNNDLGKQNVDVDVKIHRRPKLVMTELKSLQDDNKEKVFLSKDSSIKKLISTNKNSSNDGKKVVHGNFIAAQLTHRKINSLELLHKVYPQVEISTASTATSPANSTIKVDPVPGKLQSDKRNQLKLKTKTFFEFKKPSTISEDGKRRSKLRSLSSSVSSKQSKKSLNIPKISLGFLPKYQIQRLGNYVNESDNVLQSLKVIVDMAKMKHKTFTCCGGYKSIRNALESRGWIERINIYQSGYDDLTRQLYKIPISDLLHGIYDKNRGVTHRRVILSKLIGSHQVDLYWDYSHDVYHGNPDSVKLTIINSIQRGVFSYATKHGLCESSKDAHWYHKPGECHLRHPRSYSISSSQKHEEFIKDFQINACMSLLKWIADMSRTKQTKLTSDQGKISIEHFQFAVKECMKFIRILKHEDIDKTIPESSDKNWNSFLDAYSEAVHKGNHFKTNIYETQNTMAHKTNVVLEKLKKCWPYCDMDGHMNIWILKPSYGSRGIGIHICRTLPYVLRILSENKNHTYVIQKYIERPLLIFNTKFDIRQWFLISSTSPLTIWMYKECYLRFSSQTYNLRKLHESIHLTNNSVQSRYHSTANRDPSIPKYNMWGLHTFKQHLINIGYADVFESIIYPGMKECITAAILMNQDHLNKRRNSFQLHGADFMLTEDFKPWLIEINARPALYSSTPITAKMCPSVLTDTIKVVIDLKENESAETGLFELIYKEKIEKFPNTFSNPNQFVIQGHAIKKDYFQTPEQAIVEGNLYNSKKSSEIMDITNNKNFIVQVGKEMKNTLEQLLHLIHNEKNRRKVIRNQLSSSSTLRKKELKELYKKENFDDTAFQDLKSTMELKNILYNTLSNHALNSTSADAKQLHEMISKELGITSTLTVNSKHIIEDRTVETEQKSKSSECILNDIKTLSSNSRSDHSVDVESFECHEEMSVVKPTGGVLNNFLGMISNLAFS